jgi:hypothetical protein
VVAKEGEEAGVRREPAGLHPPPTLPGYHHTDLRPRDRPGPSAALRLFRRELPSSASAAVFPTATRPAAAAPADDASSATNTSSPSSAAAVAHQPSTIAHATALGVEGVAGAGGADGVGSADGAAVTGGAESGAEAATARHAWLQGVREVDMRNYYGYTDYGYTDYGYTDYGYTDYGYTDYGYTDYGYTDYGYTDYGYTDYGYTCTCKVCAWWT